MTALERIAAERTRQIEAKGYDAAHDDAHLRGEIGQAAAAYALPSRLASSKRCLWPWADGYRTTELNEDCPEPVMYIQERVGELVRAAALIVAEIERLERCLPQDAHG